VRYSKISGFPSRNAIFVAAKENGDRQDPNSFTNKWILVTSSDTEEAFKAVLSLRNLFIFITLIVLAISIIAIYIVVDRTISIPLTKLKDGAIEIAKGNLDFMITSPSTIDEIGELSSQFAKMRAGIKELDSELMRRDKELETANEQLRIRDKMQQDFINIAAHELRTPIQPILGLTGSLRSQITDTKQQALLEIIIRNAKRLKRLTDDMLDVSKIESQLLRLNKEKVDLNEIISNVVKDYRNQIIDSKRRINLLYDEYFPGVIVEADKDRITQVVSNLLSNAVKFTNDGGNILVSIRTVESSNNIEQTYSKSIKLNEDKTVIVSVKDTGVGIDQEVFPKLFKKFTSKSFQGTGLGLFISKNIIEAHDGRMWAENNIDGKGATFSFSLPLLDQNK